MSETFGTREDVPLPGLHLGPGNYLAVYRPSNGTFYWKRIGVAGVSSVQVAQPNSASFPMPGLYDADDLIDFATHDPYLARFDLVLSTLGWSAANKRIRVFDDHHTPSNSPTVGWPVAGVRRALPVTGNPVRQVFAVYDPDTGRTSVAWNVLTATSSPYTATVASAGSVGDHVLGGIRGTPASYDALIGVQWGYPGTIWIAGADATGAFPGTVAVSTSLNIPIDTFIGVIAAVSGDNVPDLFAHDGQTGNVSILTSPTFTGGAVLPLGGPYAQPL